jgi:hypothetical protein
LSRPSQKRINVDHLENVSFGEKQKTYGRGNIAMLVWGKKHPWPWLQLVCIKMGFAALEPCPNPFCEKKSGFGITISSLVFCLKITITLLLFDIAMV